ncbi:conserved membrane hypothetical protein [Sphingomonas sp. EC-HK361]|uniref:sensor domain-containing diguanylate cyclase n=1 Tax=Sphingomonas sp. EC-HK361 TaxID=2038397 RepID=UPI00125C8FE7|nr:sensor domain-containing diguanylate cyclase [Sphingomonas sp. EC-HK361]VVS96429.1 conserved membrane hypothetical protein [Sphingomonas sp. EC-HK361]
MGRTKSWVRRAWPPCLLGLAYYAVAAVSLALTKGSDGIATIWPPSGLLLAAVLILPGRRIMPFAIAAAAGSVLANLLAGTQAWVAAGFTVANITEALTAGLLLRRRQPVRLSFIDPRGLSRFFAATLAAAAVSAAIAACVDPASDWRFTLSWFTTVWLGMLLVTPLLHASFELSTSPRAKTETGSVRDIAWIAALTLAASAETFFRSPYPILFVPMIVIIIAVLRAGALGGIVSMTITATIGSIAIGTHRGTALLAGGSHQSDVLFYQVYLLALFASALPMATLLAARDRLRLDLAERLRLLDQAEKIAQLGHWRVDPTTRAIFWSPEVFRIHGRTEETPPAIDEAINAYHPDDRARVAAIVEDALRDGLPFEFEARIVRPDGVVRHVVSRGERDFSSRDNAIGLFGLIQDITDQVAARRILKEARDAAEKSAQAAQLLAETDPLTGLANRRRIVGHLTHQLAVVAKDRSDLAVVIFDIDHFKAINDNFGHAIGDLVLRRVAVAAAAGLRSTDMLGRYGGEEFVLVLADAPADVATRIAERVRGAVESSGGDGDSDPRVTVSLGIAIVSPGETLDAILRRADAALYEAKNAGRNCLCLAA